MASDQDDMRLETLQHGVLAYLEGMSGVRYETLIRFAEPLFQLYDLDLRSLDRKGARREANELATLLSILDTARLFWAYFLLDESESSLRLNDLRLVVLGPHATAADEEALLTLLQMLEDQWNNLGELAARSAAVPGFALPTFDELLEEYGAKHGGVVHSEPEAERAEADLPDALAAFATPLFDSVDLENPDDIEDALARAQAYWDLAALAGDAYERKLQRVVHRFSGNGRSENDVRREAQHMTERFRTLFS